MSPSLQIGRNEDEPWIVAISNEKRRSNETRNNNPVAFKMLQENFSKGLL